MTTKVTTRSSFIAFAVSTESVATERSREIMMMVERAGEVGFDVVERAREIVVRTMRTRVVATRRVISFAATPARRAQERFGVFGFGSGRFRLSNVVAERSSPSV